jgi:excisionase family DNA binding protein
MACRKKDKKPDPPRRRSENPVPIDERDATDVNTTAFLLGVSRRTIYSLIADGTLRTIKIRRRRLVPRSERERLLAHGTDE